jgi:AraC-like DNA-binding protein
MGLRLKRRSVFLRLALSYCLFVLVFVGVTSAIVLSYRRLSLDAEVSRLNDESLRQYAKLVNTALVGEVDRLMTSLTINSPGSALQLLTRLSSDGELSIVDQFTVYQELETYLVRSRVDAIHILEPTSGLLLSTTYGVRHLDSLLPLIRANIPWAGVPDLAEPVWIPSRTHRYNYYGEQLRFVTYVLPARARRSDDRAYLFAIDVAEGRIRSSMLNENQNRSDAYLLIDETSSIQFSVNDVLPREGYEYVVERYRDADTRAAGIVYAGERYAVSGEQLSNGWGLLRIVSMREYFRVSDQLLLGIVGVSVLFLIAGPVVAYFVSRHFYSPIASLEERVHALAGSELGAIADGADEFSHINSMLNHLDEELEEFYRERQQSLPRLKSAFVRNSIFNNYAGAEAFSRDLGAIDRSRAGSNYLVLLLHLAVPRIPAADRRRLAQARLSILRAIDEAGDQYGTYIGAELDESTIAVIHRSRGQSAESAATSLARNLAELEEIGFVWISYGATCDSYDQIRRSYTEAIQAAKHRFFEPDRMQFGPDVIRTNLTFDTSYFDRQGSNLRKALFAHEFDTGRAILQESIAALASADSSYIAKELCYNTIAQIVLNELFRLGSAFARSEDLVAAYREVATVHGFLDWCDNVLEELEEFYQDEKRVQRVQIVQMVQDHIQENLADDLSLTRLSEVTRLSNGYLSRLFFQTTGTHINEYVQTARMERARDLLLDTRMKVSEIASSCGYPTPHYFSKVFKEYYGKTPQTYRHLPSA